MSIRMWAAGTTGKTGSDMARAIRASGEFELTGAIARRSTGRDFGEGVRLLASDVPVAGPCTGLLPASGRKKMKKCLRRPGRPIIL